MATDLLGDEIKPKPRGTVPAGYAGLPGTGPAGETCGSCAHARRGHNYAKCYANKARWSHGIKTDIRLRTPACNRWEGSKP